MTKQDFLAILREALTGLPQSDVDDRVGFYAEMIDDRMEEGLTEKEAVAAIGSVEEIVLQIVDDYPIGKLVKQRIKPKRRLSTLEIILLALGFPVWFSLLMAAFVVLLSLYVSLWAVIISLWSVFASLVGAAIGGVLGGIWFVCTGHTPSGLATVAAGLVCGGLSVFAFYGCKAATKGSVKFTKGVVLAIKKACIRKGEAQ